MSSNDIRSILREYDLKRTAKENEAEYRKEMLYKKNPELDELEREIGFIGIRTLKASRTLTNEDRLKVNLKMQEDMQQVRKKIELIYSKLGLPENYLLPDYDCKNCNDTGFLKDGSKCSCLKQRLIGSAYKQSNLDALLGKQNFDTFNIERYSEVIPHGSNESPRQRMANILSLVNNFVDNFDESNGENLLFVGPVGVGKTFLSSCIAKKIMDGGRIVVYQKIRGILEKAQECTFNKNVDPLVKEAYDSLYNCDLLIIDDLGTEMVNSFVVSEVFNLIDTRIIYGRKTIISTNLDSSQIGEIYTERVFSRLLGNYRYVKFIGEDLRIH